MADTKMPHPIFKVPSTDHTRCPRRSRFISSTPAESLAPTLKIWICRVLPLRRHFEKCRPEGQGGLGGPVNDEAGRPRMASPLIETLDANHDGIIDASEIQNASAALMGLDKNSDGKMTLYELRARRPEGVRGPGGPSNQGRSGNPQEGRQGNRSEGRPQRPQFE